MKFYQYQLWLKTLSLTFIFLILINIPNALSYHITGNTIYDLEDNTSQAALTAEAAPWDLSLYKTPGLKVYYCAGYYLLGSYKILGGKGTTGPTPSYGQYFKRTYIPPVAHNQINIQMRVYAIDSWDGDTDDDHFEIGIDGVNIYALRIQGYNSIYANINFCGNATFPDFPPFTMYMSYPHTSMTGLELKVISCVDDDSADESLGFRDIKIEFVTNPTPITSLCAISSAPLYSSPCPCATLNMFMSPPNSGTCYPCSSTCASCTGSASNACTSCYSGTYMSGGQCLSCSTNCLTCSGSPTICTSCYPGKYLSGTQCLPCNSNCATCIGAATTCTSCNTGWFLVGSTCFPTCNSPLISYVSNGVTYCITPCPGQFAYWDGTCGSACSYASNAAGAFGVYPTTVNTFSICNYPCSSTTQVLYWNGTCSTSCPSPLSTTLFHGSSFCDFQCGSSQYLYWNGTCSSTCPSPLSSEVQGTNLPRKFCWFPCQGNEYLYWNGTCSSTCPLPLSNEVQGTNLPRKYCWYTCQPSEFLYWNGSCLNTCPSPLYSETQGSSSFQRRFCWFSCQPSEYLYWNRSCLTTCPLPLSGETQGASPFQRQFCWTPCQPSEYLYWNGTCSSTCPSPLSSEIQGTNLPQKFCWFACQPNEYLLWNTTCSSTCPSPLLSEIQGTNLPRKYCWYTCQPSEFLYWNGSCLSTCPSPLSGEIQGTSLQRQFCWYPCQPNEYLYWNQTCLSKCPSSLSKEIQGTNPPRNFCWYTCQPSEFLYWNGSCLSTCPSPLSGEIQGTSLQRQFCWYKCQPSEYLYWNGSCSSTCPSPLSGEIQGSSPFEREFCWYTCQPNEFLYWDGVCRSSCDFPLWPETQGTFLQRQFCWFPCQPTQSLYWNGTCSSQCNYPLSGRLFAGRRFCDYPCQQNHYLFENGSCLTSCPIGFWKNDEYRFCPPCQDHLCAICDLSFGTSCEVCKEQSILDSNNVCQDCQALSSEYIKQNDETYEYQYKLRLWPAKCDLDQTALKKYLFPTQESKTIFPPFGFQVLKESKDNTGKYFLVKLNFSSPILEEKKLNFTLGYLSTAPDVPKTPEKAPTFSPSLKTLITIINTGTLLSGLSFGSTAAFWNLIGYQQFIGYFSYLNIIYPHHLETFLFIFVETSNLEFLPNPLESLMNRLSDSYDSVVDQKEQQQLYQLPYKFESLETPTLFIINSGSTFFICLIFLIVPYLLGHLRKFQKLKNLKFLQDLHSDFKWNAIIRIFLESGIPLAFAIFIQIRKVSYANIPFALSTFCATIVLIYMCSMFHYVYQTLINLKHENMKDPNIEKSVGTLYEGLILKKNYPSGKYYYVFILLRGMLLVGVNVFIDEIPLLQIIVMIFFNVFFVFYVCKTIEFESQYLTWTSQIAEVFILIGEILMMTLCPRSLTDEFKKLIGWIIIGLFSSILASQFAYGIYLQILAVIDLVKKAKVLLKKRKQRKVSPEIEGNNLTTETSPNILITEISARNMTINENSGRAITLES